MSLNNALSAFFEKSKWQYAASLLLLLYFAITQNWLFALLALGVLAALFLSEKYGSGERKLIGEEIGKKLEALDRSRLLYALLLLSFALFFFGGSFRLIFGTLAGAALLALVLLEILLGLWKGGITSEVKETVSAILVALVVWFGASLLLSVPSPINAIVSCSMVPNLERGDMVLLRGGELNAPLIEMKSDEIAGISNRGIVRFADESLEVNGSLFFHCLNTRDAVCDVFRKSPEKFTEWHGPLVFKYSLCRRVAKNGAGSVVYPCVSSLEYKGKVILENVSNDVVVYQSAQGDLFSLQGDTIHRVFARLRDEKGNEYILTKGDNNAYFDLQAYAMGRGNSLVKNEQVKGKVLFGAPYLGYFKIFLSGLVQPSLLSMDEGCDSVFEKFKK